MKSVNPMLIELEAAKERNYQATKTALQNAFELFKSLDETQKKKLYNELAFEEILKSYFNY